MGNNGFLQQLQGLIGSIKSEAERTMISAKKVVNEVNGANTSASNVSVAMDQMSASMQEISITIDRIAEGSNHIFEQVSAISEKTENGAKLVVDIRTRAGNMYNQTMKNISGIVDESAKGIVGMAEDTTALAGALEQIKQETDKNRAISENLEEQISRFVKV